MPCSKSNHVFCITWAVLLEPQTDLLLPPLHPTPPHTHAISLAIARQPSPGRPFPFLHPEPAPPRHTPHSYVTPRGGAPRGLAVDRLAWRLLRCRETQRGARLRHQGTIAPPKTPPHKQTTKPCATGGHARGHHPRFAGGRCPLDAPLKSWSSDNQSSECERRRLGTSSIWWWPSSHQRS